MLRTVILWLLTSDNAASKTGALVGLNVFPVELPQKPPSPAVVYNQISAHRRYVMRGPDRVTPFRVQIDAFADTVSALDALGASILADLSGFKGTIPISPTVDVQAIFADDESDSAETGLETSGSKTKRKRFDFMVWLKEG